MRPLLLRPPVLCFLARRFFSGSARVTESRVRTEEFLRPGLVGLYRIAGIGQTPSKRSIRSPSTSLTTAFFHVEVWPRVRPWRLGLLLTFVVFTLATLTSKASSTARFIWF